MTPHGSSPRILVVEDDQQMGSLLERGLVAEGYRVDLVANGVDALIAVSQNDYAAATVDVMLPQMNGFELCRRIRSSGSALPLLLITARNAIADRVLGLDSGADDYLTKPFAFAELSARIRALLRRDGVTGKHLVEVGDLTIDSLSMSVTQGSTKLALSPKELSLLRLLAMTPGTVVSRASILEEVWGGGENIDRNIVDQYVSYLRRKLQPGTRITTVRGEGYLLELG
jgi:two-component system OmpR family response regulator